MYFILSFLMFFFKNSILINYQYSYCSCIIAILFAGEGISLLCLSPVYMFPKLRADRNNPKSFFFHKIFHLYSFYRNTAILLCILLKGSFFTVNNFMRKKNPNRKDNSFKLINLTSTWSF